MPDLPRAPQGADPVPLRSAVPLVAVGGALGSLARHGLAEGLPDLRVATLLTNLTGCLLLGTLLGTATSPRARLFAGTGVLGGFTTMSALAVQVAEEPLPGLALLAVSVAGGVAALQLGRRLGLPRGEPVVTLLLVALGGAAGAVVRLLVGRRLGSPRGTLAVNVAGSLVLGLAAGLGETSYVLVGIGFCGALTTFSAFAAEVLEHGRAYAALTVAACVTAAAVGLLLAPA